MPLVVSSKKVTDSSCFFCQCSVCYCLLCSPVLANKHKHMEGCREAPVGGATVSNSCKSSTTLSPTCPSQHQQFLFVAVEQVRGANVGTSLRCAVAFRADAFVMVGSSKFSTHGAHGAQAHIPILHFFHWDEFRAFVKGLNGCCEMCGLHSSTCTEDYSRKSKGEVFSGKRDTGETNHNDRSNGSGDLKVAETYNFPQAAVALLLPDRKTGRLSPQQLQVTETHLQTRFAHCRNPAVTDSVHLDVKISICLQRYAVQHQSTTREVRITEEEKFEIQDEAHNQSVFLQLFSDFKRKAKAEEMATPANVDGVWDNSIFFNKSNDCDY